MEVTDPVRVRARIRVEGIVQGVGFRPFAHAMALELGVGGFVGNDADGVLAEVEGSAGSVEAFVAGLTTRAPALAVVERVRCEPVEPRGDRGFRIVASDPRGARRTLVAADTATCDACLAEILDPADRRYRYAFTNCTSCGPRFTIVTGIPYDRPNTTMAGFAMCPACAAEYHDPADRRFHAQPTCCPACGPSLRLVGGDGRPLPGDPVGAAAGELAAGRVLAVKGLGGYHLAALADCAPAVAALRARKHREDRPFAILVADLAAARELVDVEPEAARLLTDRRRPIVLLPRRADAPVAPVAPSVAPGNRSLGLMLPYTPLHHLLARGLGRPFVLTSGNVSDEPIAFEDGDATARLAGIADAFLRHDRPIHTRTDDSVVRVFRGQVLPVRRSRGYAPEPLPVRDPFPRPVLACGAELKSTFCLGKGRHAFVSHHIGDLENYETLRSFTTGIAHYRTLFDVRPELVAHDLHPDYLSTKYAVDLDGSEDVRLVGVQHHHAHIASCLADNGVDDPVVGVAYDGLGLGTDGTLWGGEILAADLTGFDRVGHLEPVHMPGGEAAIRRPWRMALAWLTAAYDGNPPTGMAVAGRHEHEWDRVRELLRSGLNSPLTTSVGRLFDAVAALLDVRDVISYEGQAAVELEQLAAPGATAGYPPALDGLVVRGTALVRAVVQDIRAGTDPAVVAARFHDGLAAATAEAAARACEATGRSTVALSGGVFQNVRLLNRLVDDLEARGLRVLVHSRVPPNDGGVSLGQAVVAGARDRAES